MWVTLLVAGKFQNIGNDLIPGDLRLTEASTTRQRGRTYLSVVASLPQLLPTIIGYAATSIDRHVAYCVLQKEPDYR